MYSFVKYIYSGTCLPVFIKIRSYLTDRAKEKKWHDLLRHGVYILWTVKTCYSIFDYKSRVLVDFLPNVTNALQCFAIVMICCRLSVVCRAYEN